MRSIRVELRAKPERQAQLVASLAAEAREVPARFEGCERYAVFVHPEDDCRILLYEEWSDAEAFAAYRESDFFEQSGQALFPMFDGPPDSAYYESVRVGP
jgi:quinol monooxygenase YgiN